MEADKNQAEYKRYVEEHLADLMPVFANASVGDFSKDVKLPATDDAFAEMYAGVQMMLDVIREKISDLERANADLANKIHDLERLNKFMIGRELRMRELKQALALAQQELQRFKSPSA